MDTLTFNSPLLLRHLTFSEAKKAPISEINLKVVLEELDMTMERVSLSGFSISNKAKRGADCDVTCLALTLGAPVHRALYPARM